MGRAVGRLPWRHRVSVRLRITLVSALVVAVVVGVGGVLLLLTLRSELVAAADEEAGVRADEIAVLAAADDLPTPLPAMEDPEAFAEVVRDGRLVASTEGLEARNTFELAERRPGEVDVLAVPRLPLDEPGPFRVVARGVRTPTGTMTVFVAVPIAHVDDTVATAAEVGVIGLSLLVLVLATLVWLVVGRALAPVEAIRVRADAITGQSSDNRVPVPPQHDEIGRLARTVNRMLARLQHSAERQRRFVADAAHELRSPITSLRVLLETARDQDPGWHRVDDMLHETGRMQLLVDQLLLLARADADAPWLRPGPVDLDDVVDSAVGALTSDRGIRVDASAVEPVQLTGDARLLERVVGNLVSNAVDHARRVVRVAASEGDGHLAVLVVDDDGPGIPEDRRDDVFERFVRLDGSRGRDHGGVGLGLAIVAEIVHAHGGHVRAEESPLGGARLVVELPLTPGGLSGPGAPRSSQDPPRGGLRGGS
jgi:signal transduction histidine kinase